MDQEVKVPTLRVARAIYLERVPRPSLAWAGFLIVYKNENPHPNAAYSATLGWGTL